MADVAGAIATASKAGMTPAEIAHALHQAVYTVDVVVEWDQQAKAAGIARLGWRN